MRFILDPELSLFTDSMRGALAGFEAPLEPELGTWWDERDDALGSRLAALGWEGLWSDPTLLGATVAGSVELGRAVAPLCLLDEATLGAPLGVGTRVRHGAGRARAAVPGSGGTVSLVPLDVTAGVREATLDGTGTLCGLQLDDHGAAAASAESVEVDQRLRAWAAATLGYLAGLADRALEQALDHVRSREQFGAPLAALPVVQGRLADAALLRDGLALVAWEATDPEAALPWETLAWAGPACCDVSAQALQVHGGIGFALEGGVHRFYRRAKVVQVWVDAVLVVGDER